MAQTLAELYVKIGSDFQKVDADLSKLDHRIKGMDPSIQKMESGFSKVNKTIGALGGVIATIGIAKMGADILKASTTLDTLNLMLINVEGSQAKANKRFEEFKQLAKAPVLDPFNLSSSYVALRAVNVEANLSIRFMKGLGNAMAGVGAGNEQFKNAMYQIVQMAGATKILGQDLRVINESFPQMRKYLAEAFGTADPEALAKKGITATDVMTKLSDIFDKLPRFTGGAQAAQDNFRQSLMLLEGALGKTVLPKFTELITKLTELMDKFNAMPESTKNVIGGATVGLLGIAGAVMAIKTAMDLLALSSGIKALSGIAGAVNIAKMGAGASVASSAVASGLVNQYGRPISSAVAGVEAGAVASKGFMTGSTALQIATATIAIGSVVWAGSEIYKALKRDFTPQELAENKNAPIKAWTEGLAKLTELQMGKGNYPNMPISELGTYSKPMTYTQTLLGIPPRKETTDEIIATMGLPKSAGYGSLQDLMAKYGFQHPTYDKEFEPPEPAATAKGTNAGFELLLEKSKAKFGDIQSKEYQASDIKQLAFWQAQLGTPLTLEARQGVLNTIAEFQDKVNKSLKEKADERVKFLDEINALAYPEKPPPPDIVDILGITPRSATDYELYKEQKMPTALREYTPSMAGGVPAISGLDISRAGLTSGLGLGLEVSKAAQEREKSMLHIQQIIDSTSLFNEDKVSSLADEWDGVTEEMSGGIEKVSLGWDSFAMEMYNSIGGMTNMASALLSLIKGYQNIQEKKRIWKETEMQLESRVSRGEISNEEAFWIQLSTSGFTRDIAFKKLHDMGVEGYASGGWVTQPQLAMVAEREPELIIPKSKMGTGGFGGNTHIEIHAINVPTMDAVAAENLVVNAMNDARRHSRL
jgi:tape measure domain-containing protein